MSPNSPRSPIGGQKHFASLALGTVFFNKPYRSNAPLAMHRSAARTRLARLNGPFDRLRDFQREFLVAKKCAL